MKNPMKIIGVLACLLLPAAFGLQAAMAQDSESSKGEEIEQIVKEAKRYAMEWKSRFDDWQDDTPRSTTYVGVVIERVPDVLRDYIDLPKGVGLLFSHIAKDSPAERAGLMENDIIVTFDNQLIVNYSQFSTLIDLKGPGTEVPITILRKGEEMQLTIVPEERVRKGGSFVLPDAPEVPDVPDAEDLGALMEGIEEWIPGSVKIFIDENEEVHVDLQDLRENLQDLRLKIAEIKELDGSKAPIIREHGDLGARTTIVRVEERNVNFSTPEGQLSLSASETGEHATVWDDQGDLIYQGDVPANYKETLPEKAVELLDSYYQSRNKLHLDANGNQLEIQLNEEGLEPVTLYKG